MSGSVCRPSRVGPLAGGGDLVLQRLAPDVLHRDVGDVAVGLDLEDGADSGVVQFRGDGRLAFEAPPGAVREAQSRGEDLEGDLAVEPLVVGEEHRALTSRTDLAQDAVGTHAPRPGRSRGPPVPSVPSVAARSRSPLRRRPAEAVPVPLVAREERLDLGAQLTVPGASLFQEGAALGVWQVQGRVEQLGDPVEC